MKQLGNLAVVCAQRPDVLMQICLLYTSSCVSETGPEVWHELPEADLESQL